MEPSSTSMIRCVNRRDTRWIATWHRLSASWTPNQPQRPKQEENAATMGEKKVNGRKRQFWVDTNGAGAHYHMRAKRTCLSVTTTNWSVNFHAACFLVHGENFMLLRARPLCYRWTRAFIYQETHLCWFQQRYKCGVCKRLCGKQ